MKPEMAKQLKALEKENARLKKMVAEQALDMQILKEAAKGSPWENGYVESFNGTLRNESLNHEIFLSIEEACWVIDRW